MQPEANAKSFPQSCINPSSLTSSSSAELELIRRTPNEFPANTDDLDIVQYNDGPVTCSIFEKQLLVGDSHMCANDSMHNCEFEPACRNALDVETDNTAISQCPLDTLEIWLDSTSPLNMECSGALEELLQAADQFQVRHDDNSSSFCDSNACPTCSSGMVSLASMHDTNALFMESLPALSIPLDSMNHHVKNHLDASTGIHDNVTTSADGNVPLMFSGSATSGGDGLDCPASLFAAMANAPPHEPHLVLPPLNIEATAMDTQLNLEAPSCPPLHKEFKAAHSVHETRAIENSGDCDAEQTVSFLVESCAPAALDDGYRWCKYGQKNIKHQLHPRCYYKCARRNCHVKKQTESCSTMHGHVLITYRGKHNHYADSRVSNLKESRKQSSLFTSSFPF